MRSTVFILYYIACRGRDAGGDGWQRSGGAGDKVPLQSGPPDICSAAETAALVLHATGVHPPEFSVHLSG